MPKSVLIAIGCNDYTHLDDLGSAADDAQSVFDSLTGTGQFYDASASALLTSPPLSRFQEYLRTDFCALGPVDVLTFFFAGHGAAAFDQFFLCFADTSPDTIATTGFQLASLFPAFGERKPSEVNVVLDTCQAGAAMYDLHGLLTPKIIGGVQHASVSFLAAATGTQSAEETPTGGVLTSELARAIKGDLVVQRHRPNLDLIEVGRSVAPIVARTATQTPLAWGLNIHGDGRFCRNASFDSTHARPGFLLDGIRSGSAGWRLLSAFSEDLWAEFRLSAREPSTSRLQALLSRILAEATDPEVALPFLRGVGRALAEPPGGSEDLLAASDYVSTVMQEVVRYGGSDGSPEVLADLALEKRELDEAVLGALLEGLQGDENYLISPYAAHTDLFYLPLRVTRTLGWIAAGGLVNDLLGISDEEVLDARLEALETILAQYPNCLTFLSDRQGVWLYLLSQYCSAVNRLDLASDYLSKYFDDLVTVNGHLADSRATPAEEFDYLYARAHNRLLDRPTLSASPSIGIPPVLLSGLAVGLTEPWDLVMHELDFCDVVVFAPTTYSTFSEDEISEGENCMITIGGGIWQTHHMREVFDRDLAPKIHADPLSTDVSVQAACVLAAYLQPDRVPYLLESSTPRGA